MNNVDELKFIRAYCMGRVATCHSNCSKGACCTNSIVGGKEICFEALDDLQCLLDCSDILELVLA